MGDYGEGGIRIFPLFQKWPIIQSKVPILCHCEAFFLHLPAIIQSGKSVYITFSDFHITFWVM